MGTKTKEQDAPLSPRARMERACWRSRRGLLELELLLTPFARAHFEALPPVLMEDYERLLGCDDLDVHAWLLNRAEAPDEVREIVAFIRRALPIG